MVFLLFILIGLASGVVGALIGLGGGVILVPALLYLGSFSFFPGLSPQQIVGLSVIMMIFTGLSSTLAYMKIGTVDYRSGFIFFIGSAPGTVIGALVNRQLDVPSFQLYFGILLVFLSLLLLFRDRLKKVSWFVERGKKRTFLDRKTGQEYIYGYPLWFALSLSFIIGFSSGLFGIGGGSILVPAMILLFLFPPHVAVATSMFMVFLSAIVNSVAHISLGNVPWVYTLAVVPAAYAGAKIGARLNRSIQSETLVVLLRIALLLFGLRSIYEGIFSS